MGSDWSPPHQRFSRREFVASAVGGSVAASAGCVAGGNATVADRSHRNRLESLLSAVPAFPGFVDATREFREDIARRRGTVLYADASRLRDDELFGAVRRHTADNGDATPTGTPLGTVARLGQQLAPAYAAFDDVEEIVVLPGNRLEPTTLYWADWDESAVLEGVSDRHAWDDFSTVQHADRTVYVPENSNGPAVGIVDGGLTVVGPPVAVETVLGVAAGEVPSLGSEYREEFRESTSGSVQFVSRDRALFHHGALIDWLFDGELAETPRLDSAHGEYVSDGDSRGLTATLRVRTETGAATLRGALDGITGSSAGEGGGWVVLERATVTRDGRAVTVSAEMAASELVTAVRDASVA